MTEIGLARRFAHHADGLTQEISPKFGAAANPDFANNTLSITNGADISQQFDMPGLGG